MPIAWFVYILEAENGALYTGVSTDPERRLAEHRAGRKGARFFRFTRPVRFVYRERVSGRSAALRREAEIKRLSRAEKLRLVRANMPRVTKRRKDPRRATKKSGKKTAVRKTLPGKKGMKKKPGRRNPARRRAG